MPKRFCDGHIYRVRIFCYVFAASHEFLHPISSIASNTDQNQPTAPSLHTPLYLHLSPCLPTNLLSLLCFHSVPHNLCSSDASWLLCPSVVPGLLFFPFTRINLAQHDPRCAQLIPPSSRSSALCHNRCEIDLWPLFHPLNSC